MPATSSAVETISLTWHGPYSLGAGAAHPVWTAPVSGRGGVYLWAIPTSRGLLAHRVGTTERPFWRRFYQELEAVGRGEQPIHRASSLAEGRRDPLHRGLIGDANRRALEQQHFQNRLPRLEHEIRRMLSLVAVFLGPLEADSRVTERIQAAIVTRLRSAGPVASALLEARGAPGDRLPEELAMVVVSSRRPMVVGLPREFEA